MPNLEKSVNTDIDVGINNTLDKRLYVKKVGIEYGVYYNNQLLLGFGDLDEAIDFRTKLVSAIADREKKMLEFVIGKKKKAKILVEKPIEKDYPPLKHTWVTKNDEYQDGDSSPYTFAWQAGDYHNGPRCKLCDFGDCEHCNPDIYEDTSCAFEQAENKWYEDKAKVEKYNTVAKIFNQAIDDMSQRAKEWRERND